MEIRPAIASNKQRVSREDRPGQNITCAAIRVTGRRQRFQCGMADVQFLPVGKEQIGTRYRAGRATAIHDLRTGAILEQRGSGNVIGMHMGFDCIEQGQAQLLQEFHIAFNILKDGIDDDGLACFPIGHDVAAALRPVIDILRLVHVQQHGDGIGVARCHRWTPMWGE